MLLDPKTGKIYTPNTDKMSLMGSNSELTNDGKGDTIESRGNPYHDPTNGRFTSGSSGSGGLTDKMLTAEDEIGIVEENEIKPITLITDDAIDRVPFVKIQNYSIEQCAEIQRQHKELLRYSLESNECKEVAFVFNSDIANRREFKGADDRLEFGNDLHESKSFVMHNHPRNSSFSRADIIEFVGNDSIRSLSVVKNNGKVEILTKTSTFNNLQLLCEIRRMTKSEVKFGSDSEYRKVVDKFLKKYEEKGVFEWKR